MQIWSGSQQAPEYSIRNGLAMIHAYQTKQQESSKDLTPLVVWSNPWEINMWIDKVEGKCFGPKKNYMARFG